MKPPEEQKDPKAIWCCVTWKPPLSAPSDELGLSSGIQENVPIAFKNMLESLKFRIRLYERRNDEDMSVVEEG